MARAEIAADLAAAGEQVVLSSRTAHYYLPRMLGEVPIDLALYAYDAPALSLEEKHRKLAQISLTDTPRPDVKKEARIAIHSHLGTAIERGGVRLCAGVAGVCVGEDGGGVATLLDNSTIRFSRCVLATGYDSSSLCRILPREVRCLKA
ncbi:MAG: hypothetical protein SGPRY_009222 [Prymnesium sp.]